MLNHKMLNQILAIANEINLCNSNDSDNSDADINSVQDYLQEKQDNNELSHENALLLLEINNIILIEKNKSNA